jgi:[ribosomal protein S5]-alanine N-acetyltransferase
MTRVLPPTMPRLMHGKAVLRPFESRDAPLIASVAEDPLIPLITTVPTSGTEQDVTAYLERQHQRLRTGAGYSFAIADADSDEAVGQIGLWTGEIGAGRATTGYWIGSRFRRRGYLTAALRALTEWAVTLDDIDRLQLYVEPWNEGSWRAAEACGYQREGLLRRWERVGGESRDMYVYSVIPEERPRR